MELLCFLPRSPLSQPFLPPDLRGGCDCQFTGNSLQDTIRNRANSRDNYCKTDHPTLQKAPRVFAVSESHQEVQRSLYLDGSIYFYPLGIISNTISESAPYKAASPPEPPAFRTRYPR